MISVGRAPMIEIGGVCLVGRLPAVSKKTRPGRCARPCATASGPAVMAVGLGVRWVLVFMGVGLVDIANPFS